MIPHPPRSTRTYTLFPSTTLCRSGRGLAAGRPAGPRVPRLQGSIMERAGDAAEAFSRRTRSLCLGREGTGGWRSEEHTSELQSLMRISYAVFCLKKKIIHYYK